MKKSIKTLAMTGGLVGALAIGGIGTAAMANGNAYQTYKDAALSITQIDNQTITTTYSVMENDVEILSGSTVSKIDGTDSYSSTKIEGGGKVVDSEQSMTDGIMIHRVGDEYTSTTLGSQYQSRNELEPSSSSMQMMNMITDLLVGDVKTHFISSGDKITVDLANAQIPELMNVAVSAMLEQSGRQNNNSDGESVYNDLLGSLPITKEASIQSIHLDATVSDNDISSQNIVITLAGKDNEGTSHTIELALQGETTDINNTTAPSIDTQGKSVTEINNHESR